MLFSWKEVLVSERKKGPDALSHSIRLNNEPVVKGVENEKGIDQFYLVACLICTVVAPVSAASEQTLGGSVTVGEVVSITLTDAGVAGINFGSVTPPQTDVNEAAQSEATPAVKVNVEAETNVNVDIGIKGTLSTGSLALSNWKYSQTYAGTKTGLTSGYVAVYTNKSRW